MARPLRSLYWKLAGAFLAVVVVATVLQALAFRYLYTPSVEEWLTGSARDRLDDVRERLEGEPSLGDPAIAQVLREFRDDPRRMFIVFRKPDGSLVTGRRFPGPRGLRRPPPEEGVQEPPPPDVFPPLGDPERRPRFRELASQEVRVGGERVGTLVAFAPDRRFPLFPPGTPLRLIVALPVALIVAAGAGFLLFRAMVRRIRALETFALQVSGGDLDARVHNPGEDEIGRLGHHLNVMTERIAAGERQRRQLLADVSHELATPLTTIRGYAETLLNPDVVTDADERRRFLEDIVEESKRVDMLVQDLFDLTRIEAGAARFQLERIDLSDLCRRSVERFRKRFDEVAVSLDFASQHEAVWVTADGLRLEQVVDNLLGNALRYVPAGGHVRVELRPEPATGLAELRVSDDGPGFADADLPHVFDRFYRGDRSRSTEGTGLGLAIVREIVVNHGGAVRAANAPAGGAVISATLPLAT